MYYKNYISKLMLLTCSIISIKLISVAAIEVPKQAGDEAALSEPDSLKTYRRYKPLMEELISETDRLASIARSKLSSDNHYQYSIARSKLGYSMAYPKYDLLFLGAGQGGDVSGAIQILHRYNLIETFHVAECYGYGSEAIRRFAARGLKPLIPAGSGYCVRPDISAAFIRHDPDFIERLIFPKKESDPRIRPSSVQAKAITNIRRQHTLALKKLAK